MRNESGWGVYEMRKMGCVAWEGNLKLADSNNNTFAVFE
jgi:hypothetical protein